jgi:serine protease
MAVSPLGGSAGLLTVAATHHAHGVSIEVSPDRAGAKPRDITIEPLVNISAPGPSLCVSLAGNCSGNSVICIGLAGSGSCTNNTSSTGCPSGTGNQLQYCGGPVLTSPKVYLTYWDWNLAGDPDHAAPYMNAFFQGVGGSSWLNVVTQYSGLSSATGKKTSITNPTAQFGGAWYDNSSARLPQDVVDIQGLSAEAQASEDHFGYDPNGVYFLMMPHGYLVDYAEGACAYHGNTTDSQGRPLAFAVMQYMSDTITASTQTPLTANGTPVEGCGVNFISNSPHPRLDSFSIVGGHEYAEAITDPYPASGWVGANGEIGDVCEFNFTARGGYQEVSFSSGTFGIQGLWSNQGSECRTSYP